jgi:hypothetical protein
MIKFFPTPGFKQKRLALFNPNVPSPNPSSSAPEAAPVSPEVKNIQETTRMLENQHSKLLQDIIAVASQNLNNADPKIRQIAKQALLEANAEAAVTGNTLDVDARTKRISVGINPNLTVRLEGDLQASIKNLQDILNRFEINRVKAVGIDKARGAVEDMALNKQDALNKIVDDLIKHYPAMKEELGVVKGVANTKFNIMFADLTEKTQGLDVRNDADVQKANDAMLAANTTANDIVGEARLTIDPILETQKMVNEAKDYQKGLEYAQGIFNGVPSYKLNDTQKASLGALRVQFEAEYALLKANTPANAMHRTMMIATLADRVKAFIPPEPGETRKSTVDMTLKITPYKSDAVENVLFNSEKSVSEREKGSQVKLVRPANFRSANMIEGMALANIPAGSSVEITGETRAVQAAPGRTVNFEKVIYRTKDGTQIEGWVEARALPPLPPAAVAKKETPGENRKV